MKKSGRNLMERILMSMEGFISIPCMHALGSACRVEYSSMDFYCSRVLFSNIGQGRDLHG